MRYAEKEKKKILVPNSHSYSILARKFQKKIEKKNNKKLKNLFPALFLAKTGWDRPRESEKKFRPEFWPYPTQAKKFQKKKKQKNSKN